MNTDTTSTITQRLVNALTDYDRKQSTRRGYNPHALALYFEALDECMSQYEGGATIEHALECWFNDRLLAVCLKAVR